MVWTAGRPVQHQNSSTTKLLFYNGCSKSYLLLADVDWDTFTGLFCRSVNHFLILARCLIWFPSVCIVEKPNKEKPNAEFEYWIGIAVMSSVYTESPSVILLPSCLLIIVSGVLLILFSVAVPAVSPQSCLYMQCLPLSLTSFPVSCGRVFYYSTLLSWPPNPRQRRLDD